VKAKWRLKRLYSGLKVIAAKEETSCSALVEELAREIVKTRAG
jgi:hypothetical protein